MLAMKTVLATLLLLVVSLGAQPNHKMTKADFDRAMKDLSNWGRWGKDDQLGAVNLITPAKRKEAAAEVKEGFAVSLAHDAETQKAPDNPSPFVHTMVKTGLNSADYASDIYQVDFHGLAHTHMDALGHFFYQGKMYNGYSQKEITKAGAAKDSILNMKNGLMTRGVLIDIAKLKGMDYLEPGTAIYPEDLDAWEKKTGIKVSSGDAILIRTGRWARVKPKGLGLQSRGWPACTRLAPSGCTTAMSRSLVPMPPAMSRRRRSKEFLARWCTCSRLWLWVFPSSIIAIWKLSVRPRPNATVSLSCSQWRRWQFPVVPVRQ